MSLLDHPNGPPKPVELRPRSGGAASAEVIVHVVGEIDICTEPALARCLAAQLQPARHLTSLVVDMSSWRRWGRALLGGLLPAVTALTLLAMLGSELLDYVPVYRTEAATGGGWAFARWQ